MTKEYAYTITTHMNELGDVFISCEWEVPTNTNDMMRVAKYIAKLVLHSYTKDMLPYVLSSIGKKGDQLAGHVLHCIENAVNEDDDEPIIPPNRAFQVR